MTELTDGRCSNTHWTFWEFHDQLSQRPAPVDPRRQRGSRIKLLQTERERKVQCRSQPMIHSLRNVGYLILEETILGCICCNDPQQVLESRVRPMCRSLF